MVVQQSQAADSQTQNGVVTDAGSLRRRRSTWIAVALACIVGGSVLSPVLGATFYGDDYDLWHAGRMAIDDPAFALIGPKNCYRPANTWLFAAHHLLFGVWLTPYHLVTLLMHLGCGVLLGLLLSRFGSSPWAIFAAVAFWLTSPYCFEPAMFVNVSYNDLTVILVWLGLGILWPGPGGEWQRWRLAVAAGLILFSVFCKESWVIVVALAAVYELFLAQTGVRRALRTAFLLAVPVAGYLVLYLLLSPERQSYFTGGAHVFAKVPHIWAVFMMIDQLDPHMPGFGLSEAAAVVLMVGCGVLAWWRRSPLIAVGLAWFLVSLQPILAVEWIAIRYTTAPLVGFVLAMTGVLSELVSMVAPRWRRLAMAGCVAAVAAALLINAAWLQGEFKDMSRLSDVHDRLIDEGARFAPQVPSDRVLVCLRVEYTNPLVKLHEEGYAGVEKIQCQRDHSPYGMISWAALMTFVWAGHGNELFVEVSPRQLEESVPYAVVGHRDGGFLLLEPRADSVTGEVAAWTELGAVVRVLAPRVSGRAFGTKHR